ncbi:MAG: hypothetical protein Q9217_005106 [Psora testacea]
MPETFPANSHWRYDYVPHYNLDEKIINNFLKSIWGNYKYFVEHEQDELFRRRKPKK